MNPIRRELLNGLFVLVVASLMSAAFAAFQVSFNVQLWVLILIGIGIAVSGYVMFEITLRFMAASVESTRHREEEWLKRVGNPARLELGMGGTAGIAGFAQLVDAVRAMRPGSDCTLMTYVSSAGGREIPVTDEAQEQVFNAVMEQLQRGRIREYKRILCFDHGVLANDLELKTGTLRIGEGPGTINRVMGDHCRRMLETKGCSLYVAPAVLRQYLGLFGTDKACISVETFEQDSGARRVMGTMFFYDPPNGEIVEQFRQIERQTERRMVAVHKIRFPEDEAPKTTPATRLPTGR
jgi:hypothetical protein